MFKVIKQEGRARRGVFTCAHGGDAEENSSHHSAHDQDHGQYAALFPLFTAAEKLRIPPEFLGEGGVLRKAEPWRQGDFFHIGSLPP